MSSGDAVAGGGSSLRPSVQCVCRAPRHPEDGEWTAVHGPLGWGGLPTCTYLGLGLSCPSCVWRNGAATDRAGWGLPSGAAVSRALMRVGSWRPLYPLFAGKWQLWEGGLVRLCGLGEVGGGRALWSQQDCGVSGTQQPPTSTPRPSLERVSHSRECICPRPFRSLFHFTCSVPRFGEEVSSTSVSTSLSWQCVCTGRGGSAGEGERGVSGVRSAL